METLQYFVKYFCICGTLLFLLLYCIKTLASVHWLFASPQKLGQQMILDVACVPLLGMVIPTENQEARPV